MGHGIGFARWRSDVASGGNRYDDEVSAELRRRGIELREHPVVGAWPVPGSGDRERFATLLEAERLWLVDNIVAAAAPEAIEAATGEGRAVVVLMHYFPADDLSLPSDDRDALAASEGRAVRAASAVVATSAWTAREVARRYGRRDALVAVPGVAMADPAPGSERDGRRPRCSGWRASPRRRIRSPSSRRSSRCAGCRGRRGWWARSRTPISAMSCGGASPGRGSRIASRSRAARGAELDEIWRRTDLLVHTARAEAYGMVVSEALGRGIPSIVPLGTGATEAQQGAGAVFPPGEAGRLTRVLHDWLADPALRERWRDRAAAQRTRLPAWEAAARIIAGAFDGADPHP